MEDWNKEYRQIGMLALLAVITILGTTVFGFSEFIKHMKPGQQMVTIENPVDDAEDDWDKVENGIHLRTGLKWDDDLVLIEANCLACHSSKLISQNKATRSGWEQMIRWMQATQGLHDLGDNEAKILDYLSKYYAPENTGRRKNLDIDKIEWYVLNLD